MVPLLFLAACSFSARVQKSLLTPDYLTEAAPSGDATAVTLLTGAAGDEPGPYDPVAVSVDGRTLYQVVEITSAGWIELAPLQDDVDVSFWVRNPGLQRRDFTQVRTVTGALDRHHPNEIRFLPERLDEPLHLPIRQLTNVYNDYDFGEGDLLLVEARVGDAPPERYVFLAHEYGPRFKYSGGLLVTVPLAFVDEGQPESAAPVLAFTTAFSYRFRTRSPVLRWFGGNSAFVISTGVGSTALTAPDLSQPLESQILGHFTATIAGGGFEFYDFVSVQALVNVSALNRDLEEAPWALAIGFDTVQFGLFMRDLGTRLFRKNTLDVLDETSTRHR